MTEDAPDKRSPSHAEQAALGGEFISVAGYQTPYHYSTNDELVGEYDLPDYVDEAPVIGAEHHHTRERVALTSLAINSAIEIRGPSSPGFVQRLFTNDMDIEVGRSRYAALLNDDGGVAGDLVVSRVEAERYLAFSLSGAACVTATERLREHAPSDVAVLNREDGLGCLAVYGPDTLETVQPLTSTDLGRDALPYYGCIEAEVDGIPCHVVRVSYVGEFGWEFWPVAGHEYQLWETLWEAVSDAGGTVFGIGALVSLGLEKGYHEMGLDVGPDYTPFESGLDAFVDMDTDFVGKGALDPSPDRTRVCVTPDDAEFVPESGDTLAADGGAIGELIRGGYGYTIETGVGFGFVPAEYAEPGTGLELERDGDRYPATTRAVPLYDPDDSRLR